MKNSLMDLNNHLFAELERLGDEDLTPEQLDKEIDRADAISKVATQLINNASIMLDATKVQAEYGIGIGRNTLKMPELLGQIEESD